MIEHLEACSLPVSDLARSLAFYRELGFAVETESARGYAVLRVGDSELVLLSPEAAAREPKFAGVALGGAVAIHVRVSDPDLLWERVCGAARVLEPLGEREYGDRDFAISDPDGYRLVFGRALL